MLKKIQTNDQETNLIQDNVDTELTKLQNNPMFQGVSIQNVFLTAGQDNLIQHRLNRRLVYFIVTNLNANSTIWSPSTAALNNSNTNDTLVNLWCSANCTVSLWVN